MSAWIESHQSLRQHPKVRKLARRADDVGGIRGAVGLIHCLWWWCLDYAQDGDLSKFDAEDIAIACEWEGDPDRLVAMLIECGFLDNGDGLTVHDWYDYVGKLLERRERNRDRMRQARSATVQDPCVARAHICSATEPTNRTEPTEPRAGAREAPVDNSRKPRKREKEDLPPYDLVSVAGPIGRFAGLQRIGEALDDSTDLNHAIRRFLAAVDCSAEDKLAELPGPALVKAQADCRRRALERLKSANPDNPAAYLTATTANVTHLGDLVGDDFVTALRSPNNRKKTKEPSC